MLRRKTKQEIKQKIQQSQQFEDKEDKAKQMYANAPVFKALMYVALPGILISFMQGMFIFADQIMMVNLIPTAGSPNLITLFGNETHNVVNFTDAWNYVFSNQYQSHLQHGLANPEQYQLTYFSIDSLVRFTVSLITPGLYILNAITILIGMGTAVNFSKAIGARDKQKAYDAWSTGVLSTIAISVCSSAIIIGVTNLWMSGSAGAVSSNEIEKIFSQTNWNIFTHSDVYKVLMTPNDSTKITYEGVAGAPAEFSKSNTITIHALENLSASEGGYTVSQLLQTNESAYHYIYLNFYSQYHATAIKWATMYLRIDAGFNIFACFNQYFSLMIRAEGRQLYPALLASFANGLNIALDAIFIVVLKMGVDGSVTAMVIGWAFNVICFLIYIAVMENKANIVTYLKFGRIRFRYFKWEILWVAMGIGVGASIWNAGIALQGTLQDMTLASTTTGTDLPLSPSYYVGLNGIMLPMVNLSYTALYGIVQGGRALVSYSYGARRYDRIRQEYWMTLCIAIIYGILIYGLIGWGINQYILDGFNVTQGIPDPSSAYQYFKNAQFFLRPSVLQILTYAFAMPGILLFQSIGKIASASITSALNGFVFSFVSLFACQAIAIALAHSGHAQVGMDVFLYALPIDSALTAIVCFTWSSLYLKYRLGKPTRMQVKKMISRMKAIDLSLSNEPVDPSKNLPKSLVVLLK